MYGEKIDQQETARIMHEVADMAKKLLKEADERKKAVSLVPEDVRQFVKDEVERLKKVLFEKEHIGPPLNKWLIQNAL